MWMSDTRDAIVEQLGEEWPRADQPYEAVGHRDANRAAGEGRREALEQELQEDLARAGAKRLANADLARPLLHVDEHDVHDADAADGQRQDPDEGQHDLQPADDAVGDLARLSGPERRRSRARPPASYR